MSQANTSPLLVVGISVAVGLFAGYCIRGNQLAGIPGGNPKSLRISGTGNAPVSLKAKVRLDGENGGSATVVTNQAGITPEDWAATRYLREQGKRGDYVLKWESPVAKKLIEDSRSNIVSKAAIDSSVEYDRVFLDLGMPRENGEQLKNHLSKIYFASLEVEDAMVQLLAARMDYDKRLRVLLAPEKYATYLDYEKSKPALREFAGFHRFLEKKGASAPDPEVKNRVVSLMKTNEAYLEDTWSGPFDPMPAVTGGEREVTAQFEERAHRIGEFVARIEENGTKAGIPEDYRKLLKEYYTDRIEEKRKNLARIINGPKNPSLSQTSTRKQGSGATDFHK